MDYCIYKTKLERCLKMTEDNFIAAQSFYYQVSHFQNSKVSEDEGLVPLSNICKFIVNCVKYINKLWGTQKNANGKRRNNDTLDIQDDDSSDSDNDQNEDENENETKTNKKTKSKKKDELVDVDEETNKWNPTKVENLLLIATILWENVSKRIPKQNQKLKQVSNSTPFLFVGLS